VRLGRHELCSWVGRVNVVIRKAQGFALIDLVFVCGIIGLLSSIAVPRMLLAQQAAGASSAIGSLRTIGSAELTYALTCGSGFYAPNLTTLGTPPPGSNDAFIAPTLSLGNTVVRSGYLFQLDGVPYAGAPAACNGSTETAQGFRAAADPIGIGNTRFFANNAGGSIYEHTVTLFADMPELGEPIDGRVLR
jgi:type IV pilus assembly protein PilA